MSTFQSFKPKKYSRNKKYIAFLKRRDIFQKNSIYANRRHELCANCGYPAGQHFGKTCPTKEDTLPYLKPVKCQQSKSNNIVDNNTSEEEFVKEFPRT